MSHECGGDGKEETGRKRETRTTRAYEVGRHRRTIAEKGKRPPSTT
jgi:hypothetical protein